MPDSANANLDRTPAAAGGSGHVSLEGCTARSTCRTIRPASGGSGGRSSGPAFLVSVGYMDPGNWGTDLQAGAQFKYGLLWVVALASLMAIVMQVLSARLGVVTGKDLAQAAATGIPRWTPLAELARCASSPSAPATWPRCSAAPSRSTCCSTSRCSGRSSSRPRRVAAAGAAGLRHADHRGRRPGAGRDHRRLLLHRDLRPAADPARAFCEMGRALVTPGFRKAGMSYVAIGIIGATVMPHNLYLHSALVQSRKLQKDERLDPPGDPVQHDRLGGRAVARVPGQRRHPGAGGDGVLRQGRASTAAGRRGRHASARTPTGSASPI